MSFPLYFILLPYSLFLLIYLIFILMDIYHLILFSEMSIVSFFMTFIFLAGVVYALYWTWQLSLPIDWKQVVTVFQNISFSPQF